MGEYLVLLLTAGIGIAGLFLAASAAITGTTYVLGLALAAGAVIYVFVIIKRHFDRVDQSRH